MNFYVKNECRLFDGLTDEQLDEVLPLLDFRERKFIKDQVILTNGDSSNRIGYILEGRVRVEHRWAFGSVSLINILEVGDTFNDSHAVLEGERLVADYIADCDCRVISIDSAKLLSPEDFNEIRARVASNLLKLLAARNIELLRHSSVLVHHTIRRRVMGFLSFCAKVHESNSFDLDINRTQMAEHLSVDRSALSAELSAMQEEGLIKFKRNHFELLVSDD